MDTIRNMHELRFSNIYILSNIVYYVLPLTKVIVLVIKAVGCSKFRQSVSDIFAMHYGDNQRLNMNYFFLEGGRGGEGGVVLFQTKILITSWLKRWKRKQKNKNTELISRLKYAQNIFPLKKFHGCFLTHIKTARL